jgi:hypothetical protein
MVSLVNPRNKITNGIHARDGTIYNTLRAGDNIFLMALFLPINIPKNNANKRAIRKGGTAFFRLRYISCNNVPSNKRLKNSVATSIGDGNIQDGIHLKIYDNSQKINTAKNGIDPKRMLLIFSPINL